MNRFRSENMDHIRAIFQEKTGVELPAPVHRPLRAGAAAAAALVCLLALSAFTMGLFSDLAGDELSLGAVYQGDGIVTIQVENLSGKNLKLQPKLKLMRWTTGEELAASGPVNFDGLRFSAHSSGTMTVDLSEAYDLSLLETPLEGTDWYYLVLTNDQFLFGQDWMCAVDFAGNDAEEPAEPPAPITKPEIPAAPAEAVSSVSPVLPGNKIAGGARLRLREPEEAVMFDPSVPAEEQLQLTGLHWHTADAFRRPLAGEGEYALVLSAGIPQASYRDTVRDLPLFYMFTYEKAAIAEDAYAFICGELVSFADLKEYRVYEDEEFVCYELGALVYGGLDAYVQDFLAENTDLRYDAQIRDRIDNIYAYYQENLENLLYFGES